MRKTMKSLAGILVLLLVMAAAGIGTYFYLEAKNTPSGGKSTLSVKKSDSKGRQAFIEVEEKRTQPVAKEFPFSMPEVEVQNALHGMTHQKITAEDKWGFLPMTDERVKRLLLVVKRNEMNYEHDPVYMEMLKRWEQHDFSLVDKDHNTIWKLQGGTVGEATGIMTLEEEETFIKEHYQTE
ncbi:DUF6241 domain-containing protein [Peribacillus sp. SCS-37]|uniref:DUF6241 domain-containing protein n=1 Tax=Paraperibacillus esterisolvens TaxID=3115296 RepID=UPI003906732E